MRRIFPHSVISPSVGLLVVADLLVVSHYVVRTGEVWELSAFRSEAMSAREQTAAFMTAIDDLKKRIEAMYEVNQRLRVMLGIEVPKSGDMVNGRGGEDVPLLEGGAMPGLNGNVSAGSASSGSSKDGGEKSNQESAVGVDQSKNHLEAVAAVKDGLEWLSKATTAQERILSELSEAAEQRSSRWASTSGHSHFPVCQRHVDNVLGVVSLKDVLPRLATGQGVALPEKLHQPLFVGETTPAVRLPELLRRFGTHIAIVIDENGGVQGLVTLDDLLTAVVGSLPEIDETPEEPEVVQREDGSWLVDGVITPDRLRDHVPIGTLPGEAGGDFETLAGFLLTELQRVPRPGDYVTVRGLRLEIVDMDGHRIDKGLITLAGRATRRG